MLSLSEIVRTNASTFYNFRTGRRQNLFPRYLLIGFASLVISIFFGKLHDDLYTGLIAVQSIIVGFAFNLLFYLSTNPIQIPDRSDFLEDETKSQKLSTLAEELFYNISYFNLAAILSISLSCSILLANAFDALRLDYGSGEMGRFVRHLELRTLPVLPVALRVLVFVTVFSTIESFVTFVRIVKRLTYLFKEKMALEKR